MKWRQDADGRSCRWVSSGQCGVFLAHLEEQQLCSSRRCVFERSPRRYFGNHSDHGDAISRRRIAWERRIKNCRVLFIRIVIRIWLLAGADPFNCPCCCIPKLQSLHLKQCFMQTVPFHIMQVCTKSCFTRGTPHHSSAQRRNCIPNLNTARHRTDIYPVRLRLVVSNGAVGVSVVVRAVCCVPPREDSPIWSCISLSPHLVVTRSRGQNPGGLAFGPRQLISTLCFRKSSQLAYRNVLQIPLSRVCTS